MTTLLVLDNDAPIYVNELKAKNIAGLTILAADHPESARSLIKEADIILGQPAFTAPLLHMAGKLRWLQSTFAGVEPLCSPAVRRDYILTGVKNVFGPLMSEYVFAYILARERSLFETRANQKKKKWSPIPYQGLEHRVIGIVGLGSIGRKIATTACHFGMQVFGMKRTREDIADLTRLFLPSDKSAFLPQVDYLVLTLPATPQTTKFIGLSDLQLMKPTSIIMSVGRGSNIDQDGLVTALRKRYIGGAVLDVFEQEPLPQASPLWNMDNVLITPHNSAFSFPAQITALFCENYARFIAGKQLKYIVDFENGY